MNTQFTQAALKELNQVVEILNEMTIKLLEQDKVEMEREPIILGKP